MRSGDAFRGLNAPIMKSIRPSLEDLGTLANAMPLCCSEEARSRLIRVTRTDLHKLIASDRGKDTADRLLA